MVKRWHIPRQVLVGILLIACSCAAAEAGFAMGWLATLENIYYDLWHKLAGVRAKPGRVAIVAIDNQTLLEHREEPLVSWGPHFARGIEVLRQVGASVVGVDYLFSVSAESWLKKLESPGSDRSRTYDIPMRAQLASGNVVLVGSVAADPRGDADLLLPIQDYLFSLPGKEADVGLANLYTDPDGVVRQFVPALFDDGSLPSLTFAALLAVKAAGLSPSAPSWDLGGWVVPNGPVPRPVGFLGPPGTVPTVSLSQLLRDGATADPEIRRLRGRVVILAADHVGMQDIHMSPYARAFLHLEGRMMSGAEIHANIVETLLTGRFPRSLPSWARMAHLLALASAGTLLFLRLPPLGGFWSGAAVGALTALTAYALFRHDWVAPVAGPQMALAVAFLGALGFRLTGEERERARLRQMFGRYVSDEVVQKLLGAGHSPDLGGEGAHVTVLFSDIRNFTTISERLTPHEVVQMLNAYFGRACDAVLAQGGTVDKFIGDAIMAVFGSPVPYPDHALRALQAGLAMREAAAAFRAWMQARFPDRGLPEFAVGIGVHTGEAVVGSIGSPRRMEFTAIGDTVNTASRLEGKTKELGWTLVASKATVEAAGGAVLTGGQDIVNVKGRGEPVEVYEVVGVRPEKGGVR
jgi:class 3 adenylate cyclase